jgi:hypothetical protein
MSTVFHERARIASLTRSRAADDPELIAAKRNLAVLNIEDYVQRVLSAAPPLTAEQRAKLAELLRPVREVTA